MSGVGVLPLGTWFRRRNGFDLCFGGRVTALLPPPAAGQAGGSEGSSSLRRGA